MSSPISSLYRITCHSRSWEVGPLDKSWANIAGNNQFTANNKTDKQVNNILRRQNSRSKRIENKEYKRSQALFDVKTTK